MKIVAETYRLILRETGENDAQIAFLLNSDPEVIRYTGDGPFSSIEDARDFLKRYDHYQKYGFGRWAVIEKSSGDFVGWCGLKYTAERDEHDIGFRFFKKHWGKGYATEAAIASLQLGFQQFSLNTIVGRAAKENLASIRVLEKIGLTYLRDDICHHDEAVIYKMTREDFLKLYT